MYNPKITLYPKEITFHEKAFYLANSNFYVYFIVTTLSISFFIVGDVLDYSRG